MKNKEILQRVRFEEEQEKAFEEMRSYKKFRNNSKQKDVAFRKRVKRKRKRKKCFKC